MTELSATAVRPQPIRDAIVAYLTEPRFARDSALHLKQSLRTVRTHLAALRRQDLINCAGHGVHAHSGSQAVVSVSQPARGEATRALCARIAPLLTWRRSVQGLSLETGIRKADIAAALDGLCRLGLVSGDAASRYRLTAAGARKYAFRASTDAMPHLSHAEAVLPRAVRRASG